MFPVLLVGGIGVLFVILGLLLWKKDMITLMHDYHCDKVTDENRHAFCALSGIGMLCIGAGLLITAVLLGITNSAWSFLAFAAGFVVGLPMMIRAVSKYNR